MTTQMDKFKHLSIYKVLLIWLAKLKLTEAHRAKAYYMAESELRLYPKLAIRKQF